MRIALAGDLLVTRQLRGAIDSGYLSSLIDVTGAVELTVGNMETLLHDYATPARAVSGGTWLRAEPVVAAELREIGFAMLARANNHALDFGSAALVETSRHLERAGLRHAGAGTCLAEALAPAIYCGPERPECAQFGSPLGRPGRRARAARSSPRLRDTASIATMRAASPASRDRAKGWAKVHTLMIVVLWVVGWVPPAGLAAWLDRAHGLPPLAAVGAFVGVWLAVLCAGHVALFEHAELREAAATGAVDRAQRRRAIRGALSLSGALAGFAIGGTAVAIGVLYLIGYVARWLERGVELPLPAAASLAAVVVLGGLLAVAVTVGRLLTRDEFHDNVTSIAVAADPAGHAVGPRRLDPLRVEDVESVTGQRVQSLIRPGETVMINLDWAAEEEFWELLFVLESDHGVHCAVHGHAELPVPRTAAQARTYRKRGYRNVATLDRPSDAVAGTARDGHHLVWAQLDQRWTVEITLPPTFSRETGITLLRSAVDRLQRFVATGDLPVPPEIAPSARAMRTPAPVQPDDFTAIFGHPADLVDEAADPDDPSRSETGWWDDYWSADFAVAGGVTVDVRAHWLGGDTELLACDRQAWAQLGSNRPLAVDGGDAMLIDGASPFEYDDDQRALWVSVNDRWVLQLVASREVADAQLARLAATAVTRLRELD